MNHFSSAMTRQIAPSIGSGARVRRGSRASSQDRPTPRLMLGLHILGVAALVVASVAAIADQSARLVSGQEILGVHEIPAFIASRVELTPGLIPDGSVPDPGCDADRRGPPGGLLGNQCMPEQG